MATTSITCRKKHFGCAENVYSFQIGVRAYPGKDSIHVGDTIWIEINEPVNLKDYNSGTIVNFSNSANLGMGISFLEFLEGTKSAGATEKFKLVPISGVKVTNNYDPLSLQEFLFKEEGGFYKFKLGVIAKGTGRFVITISDAANVYRKNDACTKASFIINYEQTNQHFYLLQQWRPDLILDDLSKGKVYYFKVN